MRVEVRGVIYETVRDCALALEVSESTVRVAICRGTTDGLGLGAGRRYATSHAIRPREVVIDGRAFPSIAALARAIGWPQRRVRGVLDRHGEGYDPLVLEVRMLQPLDFVENNYVDLYIRAA